MFEVSSDHFRKTIDGPWEVKDRTHYRLDIGHENKTIHVTGQPSAEEDWPDNFDFRVRPFSQAERWFPDKEIMVHAGFLRQYLAIRNILLDAAYAHEDYAIRVDGFSLGTELQIFMQDCFHRWGKRDIKGIFYAPVNPWRWIPKHYQELLAQNTIFVRSIWDPVTWMRALRFYRYGQHITIGKPWRIWPGQHDPDQIIRGLDERKVYA